MASRRRVLIAATLVALAAGSATAVRAGSAAFGPNGDAAEVRHGGADVAECNYGAGLQTAGAETP